MSIAFGNVLVWVGGGIVWLVIAGLMSELAGTAARTFSESGVDEQTAKGWMMLFWIGIGLVVVGNFL